MHNKLILDGVEFHDGDYDDNWDIAPGDTALCTECLCKGMKKFKKLCTSLEETNIGRLQSNLIDWMKIK